MKKCWILILILLIVLYFLSKTSKDGFDGRPDVPNTPAELGRQGPLVNLFQIPNMFLPA